MTLHSAIENILRQEKRKMTPVEIAEALNKNSWYSKKDGTIIKSSQIGARVKNYPHLFIKDGSFISLKSNTGINSKTGPKPIVKTRLSGVDLKPNLAVKVLMNDKNFKLTGEVAEKIPNHPGLYCLRIKQPKALPSSFSNILEERKHNILYIGLASQSLRKRLNQELRAKGHGTFFRSLGAVHGYRPEPGSLIGKRNQNNYRFKREDENEIINWINENLLVNWVHLDTDLADLESGLLQKYLPLLNIAGNPGALKELNVLRNACKEIARG